MGAYTHGKIGVLSLLPNERVIRETSHFGNKVTLTTCRLIGEDRDLFARRSLLHLPLESIDATEELLISRPSLLVFGIPLFVVGIFLYTSRLDGAVGLMLLGVLLAAIYALTRKRGVAFHSSRVTVFLRGTQKDIEQFRDAVELQREARIEAILARGKQFSAYTRYLAAVPDPQPAPENSTGSTDAIADAHKPGN